MIDIAGMPAISIVIPVYNSAHTISRAIQSILIQDFTDYEIVVVNDGSSDDIANIIKNINIPVIRYFCHETNKGEAAARTTGVQKSRGAYIAYLDADDEWLPGKLEKQVEALSRIDVPIKACITSTYVEDRYGRISFNENPHSLSWYKDLMLGCHMDPGATLLVSRSAFDSVGYYDVNLPRYTDWDWMLRYTHIGYPLISINQPLAKVYRLTSPASKTVEKAARYFLDKHSGHFLAIGHIYSRKAISRRWMEVASAFALEHNLLKMLLFLIKGIIVYPFQPFHVWAWLINNWFNVKIGVLFFIKKDR